MKRHVVEGGDGKDDSGISYWTDKWLDFTPLEYSPETSTNKIRSKKENILPRLRLRRRRLALAPLRCFHGPIAGGRRHIAVGLRCLRGLLSPRLCAHIRKA